MVANDGDARGHLRCFFLISMHSGRPVLGVERERGACRINVVKAFWIVEDDASRRSAVRVAAWQMRDRCGTAGRP